MEFNLFKNNFEGVNFTFKKPTILIVEDSREDAELISHEAGLQGISVEVAYSAEEALGILQRNGKRFCAVTVDLNLPGMDGWDFIRKIKKSFPKTFVWVVSGRINNIQTAVPVGFYLKPKSNEGYYDLIATIKSFFV